MEVIASIRPRGLTDHEAEQRLIRFGPNQLPRTGQSTLFKVLIEVLKEPVFQLLCVAGLIYFVLGNIIDAAVLSVFVALSASISIIQQRRADRVLDSLRELASPRAFVVRADQHRRIAARDVVPGDLVVLAEGDRVPADVRLLSCQEFYLDESLLTGESVPVEKWSGKSDETGIARLGCLAVRGNAVGRVIATGTYTEFGKIGLAATQVTDPPGQLESDIGRLVRMFTVLAIVVSLVVFGLAYRAADDWVAALLAGITAAMGLIPEEFAVVLVTFMAMGAWRISQHHVLTRRKTAIERLGSATVLCVDKTGTLTLNQMQVLALSTDGRAIVDTRDRLSEASRQLVTNAALACSEHSMDPTERAILDLYGDGSGCAEPTQDEAIVRAYALSAEFSAVTNVRRQNSDQLTVAMKGAPEAVLPCCDLSEENARQVLKTASDMARQGYRVLAVARADWGCADPLPEYQREFYLNFSGLIGLADPLRPRIPEAIARCKTAGIRVVMITGDHPATALAISQEAGVVDQDLVSEAPIVITGDALEQMSDSELEQKIECCSVYARIRPNQKLRIVQAYQRMGHVVAMTGDGVNDSPALKAADIGIAMGHRGTDVAREAADLVLLNDDFTSIVLAIERGRQIYQNLRKAIAFIVTIHIPIAGLAALPGFFGLAPILLPVHIAFMEMIIDPAGSFVYESQESADDLMRRPPRDRSQAIYSQGLFLKSALQGLTVLVALLLAAGAMLIFAFDQAVLRSLLFISLVTSGLVIVTVNLLEDRPAINLVKSPNIALLLISSATVGMLVLALFVPWLRAAFHFAPLEPAWFLAALALGWFNYIVLKVIHQRF
ncbi:MAG: cation-translocating P-type ATPase [Betaproteobacteria bacterium]|nr:cation-translocating P-type ATPase [Betaproteobacteria bacterium]